ncbi:MAG: SDR family oxidoreductase [Pseudomonadota bacterium]
MTSWLQQNTNAVITGGASGIGLATANHLLQAGMNVLIADTNADALAAATAQANGPGRLETQVCNVANVEEMQSLADRAAADLGDVHLLMNNAGTSFGPAQPWEKPEQWRKQIEVNLWGIINGCQAFVPAMLAHSQAGAVINTGSKQGITNPPGNYAYNLSKAGVRSFTESLAHAFRQEENCNLSAHLLIPGFTYTGLIQRFLPEKPPGAWASEQVVDFMIGALQRNDFYILCPDNETPRELDEKRIAWNTGDLLHNRSALSRWDPAYADEFEKYMNRSVD